MPFANPITGGQGALVRPSIHSPGFVSGSTGWTINKDGSAEFNNATFRGTVVIEGNKAVLFYSGVPAAGNLVASISPIDGSDSFGNSYNSGFTIGEKNATNSWLHILLSSGTAGGTLYFHTQNDANESRPSAIISGYTGTGGGQSNVSIYSALKTGDNQQVAMQVLGNPVSGSQPLGQFIYVDSTLTVHQVATFGPYGFTIPIGFITALQPLTGGLVVPQGEVWHNASLTAAATNIGAPWSNTRYRMEGIAGGVVRLTGRVSLTGTEASGTVIFVLPVGYRPTFQQQFVTVNNLSGIVADGASITIDTSGNVKLATNGIVGNQLSFDNVTFPID